MMVIAHAHVAEWKAGQERERALARLSVITSSIPDGGRVNWKRFAREVLRARVAYHEACCVFYAAVSRHSRWYRAYLRTRGGPFIVWTGGAS